MVIHKTSGDSFQIDKYREEGYNAGIDDALSTEG